MYIPEYNYVHIVRMLFWIIFFLMKSSNSILKRIQEKNENKSKWGNGENALFRHTCNWRDQICFVENQDMYMLYAYIHTFD